MIQIQNAVGRVPAFGVSLQPLGHAGTDPTMRVAMITDHAATGEVVDGGVQAVTKYLLDALVPRTELELHVVTFKYNIKTPQSTLEQGYWRHILPGAGMGTLTAFRKDQQALDALLETVRPDVVHGQGAGHDGILASRSRFPSVITIHGIMAEEARFLSKPGRRARHWLLSKISDRHCISRGEHTILISAYVGEYFRDRLAGKHYYIPNPIADAFFEVQPQGVSNRLLFAGRLYHLKGVADLIQAFAEVARSLEIELVLAGSLDDTSYVAQLKEQATRLGISERVHFLGLLSGAKLRDELSSAAALVLPSYQETAPMVVVEAMAAGVPVIASDVGGVRHLVKDGKTGLLVKPGDVAGLVRNIELIFSDRSRRAAMSAASRAAANDEYRADRVADRILEVYRHAASCRS